MKAKPENKTPSLVDSLETLAAEISAACAAMEEYYCGGPIRFCAHCDSVLHSDETYTCAECNAMEIC